MTKPKALIVRTAGTNCDRETVHAFSRAGAKVDLLNLNRVIEAPGALRDYRILVFPGGFTYGDDLGAGSIFANRIRAALLDPILRFVDDGGLVLGICNGFQILVKTGLLPALDGPGTVGEATLTGNESDRFEDRWVLLEATSDKTPFVRTGDLLFCPAAHREGRFVPRDEETLSRLQASGQIVLRYVGRAGEKDPPYPDNPNGSVGGIAGVSDPTGRILGLMPHPERHVEPVQHPRWTRDGIEPTTTALPFFRNAVTSVS